MTRADMAVAGRAQLAAWRAHVTRARDGAAAACARRSRELLVICGALGLLGGAAIVGMWLLGLTLMAESGFAAWVGLAREDGSDMPARGARTVEQVLDTERLRP